MTKIVKEFDVGASPERVYQVVSNPEAWPQWATFVRAAKRDGRKTHWQYEMGQMKVESDTIETVSEKDRVYGFRQASGFLKTGETGPELRRDYRADTGLRRYLGHRHRQQWSGHRKIRFRTDRPDEGFVHEPGRFQVFLLQQASPKADH